MVGHQREDQDMTITITAYTNNKARLMQKKAVFTFDPHAADAVADIWESEGFIVRRHVED